ncbi:MAG: PQ-loop repeat-containing protein [Nanoarchaeota archaeon]
MDVAQILGWIATLLFSVMVVPQMLKTIKTKDTSGVSLALFVIYLVGNIIALIYALLISQPPLVFKYVVAILTTIIYIGLFVFYYRSKNKPL